MELGGQDQWGNMVAGTELIRRMSDERCEVHCLTIPLLMNPATGQKFGKSIGGASVWLDVERTSVFDYYQFWRNSDDGMVEELLCKFALDIPVEEAHELVQSGNINRAKEILAYELTALVHGEEEAKKAEASAKALFGGSGDSENMPTTKLEAEDLVDGKIDILTLLVKSGLCSTKSDARRNVQQGGVSVNDEKVTDIAKSYESADFAAGLILRRGKKNYNKVVM